MKNFGRILVLLRSERGYTQKRVAEELDISQALLSHYEKGSRECGLDFVVRVADYYGVSCDYLLGRTSQRDGSIIALETPHPTVNAATEYPRRLIANSISLIFAVLDSLDLDTLTIEMTHYLFCAVYKAFRVLYTSNFENPPELFSIDSRLSGAMAEAHMAMSEAKSRFIFSEINSKDRSITGRNTLPPLSPDILIQQYPKFAPSIFALIKHTEKILQAKQ